MGDGLTRVKQCKQCKQCRRPLDERRRGRPKRFCSRWHRVRYWLEELGELVLS
ncbi:hypothetical protein ACFVHW_05240 [Streptomyces sp. NPDC127110]|uniref:hypothetical protein n=1 Tax=Streptomyces sp. NPDC127110 TaxID=3345362 RepID=UPI0036257B7B